MMTKQILNLRSSFFFYDHARDPTRFLPHFGLKDFSRYSLLGQIFIEREISPRTLTSYRYVSSLLREMARKVIA